MDKEKIAIVGGGRLGKALAYQLKIAGYNLIGISCRSETSARKAGELTGVAHDCALNLAALADIIFITVPDDALQTVCEWLANNADIRPNTVILHCSGSRPSSVLQAAKTKQAFIASLHPLQSFSGFSPNINPFNNINFTVEGEPFAVATARGLAVALGGARCYTIDTNGKILYHIAAVAASNYLVTLFNMAATLLENAGIAKNDAFTMLAPLLNGTLKNLADNAPHYEMALTGPISRGDREVLLAHLNALKEQTPQLLDLYKALGHATVSVASSQHILSNSNLAKLDELLFDKDNAKL